MQKVTQRGDFLIMKGTLILQKCTFSFSVSLCGLRKITDSGGHSKPPAPKLHKLKMQFVTFEKKNKEKKHAVNYFESVQDQGTFNLSAFSV